MELPEDVLAIISAYSKPVTRADWKSYIVMSEARLHYEVGKQSWIRHRRITMAYGAELLRLHREYKQIFDNNHYKDFKYKYCDYIIDL